MLFFFLSISSEKCTTDFFVKILSLSMGNFKCRNIMDACDTIQNVVIDERSFLPFTVVFVIKDSEEELIKVARLFAFCLHRLQSKTSNKIVKSTAGVFQGGWELLACSYRVILWGSLLPRHNCQHIESNRNWLFSSIFRERGEKWVDLEVNLWKSEVNKSQFGKKGITKFDIVKILMKFKSFL